MAFLKSQNREKPLPEQKMAKSSRGNRLRAQKRPKKYLKQQNQGRGQ